MQHSEIKNQYPNGRLFLWSNRREKEEYILEHMKSVKKAGGTLENIQGLTLQQRSRDRLRELVQGVFPRGKGGHFETLHGFCMRVLNREGYRVGLKGNLDAIAGWQEYLILKSLLSTVSLHGYEPEVSNKNGFIRLLLRFFSHLAINNISAVKLRAKLGGNISPRLADLANLYEAYNDYCQRAGYIPLAVVVPTTLRLLQENPALLKQYLAPHFFLIVEDADQLQPVQAELVQFLAQKSCDTLFTAAKKPFQIRAFRTANCTIVGEGQIVSGSGSCPEIFRHEYKDAEEEAFGVAAEVANLLTTGVSLHEVVICLNNPSLGSVFGRALAAMGIPCKFDFGKDRGWDPVFSFFYNYLEALTDPTDNERQLQWLTSPLLQLDDVRLRRCYYRAQEKRQGLLCLLIAEDWSDAEGERVRKLIAEFFTRQQELETRKVTPFTVIENLYTKERFFTRYLEQMDNDEVQEETYRVLAGLRSFLHLARECDRIHRILTGETPDLAQYRQQLHGALPYLQQEAEELSSGENCVTIISLKDAVRLAPRVLFLVGMACDIFPSRRNPITIIEAAEWEKLQEIFQNLNLPLELDSKCYYYEQEATLAQAIATASDMVHVSWARSYPDIFETGPSNLLPEGVGCRWVAGGITPATLFWPEPAASAATWKHLSMFYLQQAKRLDFLPLSEQKKLFWIPGLDLDKFKLWLKGESQTVNPQVSYYTPAAIRTYLACPRQYLYENLIGLEKPSQLKATFGMLLHAIFEKLHRHYPSLTGVERQTLFADMEVILEESWNTIAAPALGDGMLASLYKREAEMICKAYLEQEICSWEAGRQVAQLEFNLDFVFQGYRLRGRVDRIDKLANGNWEIIDYKTGRDKTEGQRKREILPPAGERPEDLQLIVYYLGASKMGLVPASLTWYQVRELLSTGGKVKRCLAINEGKIALNHEELVRAEETLLAVLTEMRKGDYPAMPRNVRICYYCDYKFICPGQAEGEDDDGE